MNTPKVVKRAVLRAAAASAVLLVAAGVASAANVTVNLTAQRTSTTLPDGMTVPMWGYCTTGSTCASWAPGPTITAAPGDSLTINLTNALPTPTSIVILGQLGGGLGAPTMAPSPVHPAMPLTTWPAVSASTYTPPAQPDRARSFVPEAAAQLGTAAGTQSYTWAALQPGTYLYETGTQPSIQAPMGLYGLLVVTSAPAVTAATTTTPAAVTSGHAYPTVAYDADVSLLFSEIDPVQNAAVDAVAAKAIAAGTAIDTTKPSAAACAAVGGDATCYPPAVNYAPLYFLINGQAFDATQPLNFPVAAAASAAGPNGNVLLRMVNAGSRTHVPSVVGLPMALMAEDAHVPPGNPKVQSEVLLTAGKVFDVLVNPAQSAGAYTAASYAVFDRQLSLTTGNRLNGGMHGYLQVAGGATAGTVGNNVATAQAVNDVFTVPLNTTTYSNNVLANDIGIKSAAVQNLPAHGTVALGANGTFTYTATGTSVVPDTFSYCGNGTTTLCATVTLNVAASFAPPVAANQTYTSQVASLLKVVQPGVTAQASYVDTANVSHPYTNPVTAVLDTAGNTCGNVNLQPNGAFEALPSTTNPASCTFTYHLVNGQKVASNSATVTINFPAGNGIAFTVLESKTNAAFANSGDFQWVIEEDRTFHNPLATNTTTAIADTAALNFHASHMPLVASGCTGPMSCQDGQTIAGLAIAPKARTFPQDVVLDPTKYYFISILPGDAANGAGNATAVPPVAAGHSVGGSPITPGQKAVTITVPKEPLPVAQLSIFVFEDDGPTNGDIDGNESNKGLGGFQVILNDAVGRAGQVAGQITYDAFGFPLTNALFTLSPKDCPGSAAQAALPTGVILTCPEKRADGTASPLAGHAVIQNMMQGRFDVLVNPSAAREGKGETWLQTSTLEGTHANDAFTKLGEPRYFQEFGPPGFHAFVGFVNPDHLNARTTVGAPSSLCPTAAACPNQISGRVTNLHMSRPSQTQLYDANSNTVLSASVCYVGLNSQNGTGSDVGFAYCNPDGTFTLPNKVPDGTYQLVIWDQWLDQIISYKTITVPDAAQGHTYNVGNIPVFSWFTNIGMNAILDTPAQTGISNIPMTVRYRDGTISNISLTDSSGNGGINELFPLFNWYVVESDMTRFTTSRVETTTDGGGAVDATGTYAGILTTKYPTGESTLDTWLPGQGLVGDAQSFGAQGFISQTNVINWYKRPYNVGENGGITGMVIYASTRGLDNPRLLKQLLWMPGVPRVTVNLYREGTAPDGSTTLEFVKSTQSSSWDDNLPTGCKGQLPAPPAGLTGPLDTTKYDPFVSYTLGQANISRCYDGFHNWNQFKPAVYDGRYRFTGIAPGKYVVEVVPPAGYEIVKEEDKNVLIGDAFVGTATPPQFGALSNIFILPDQATINAAANNNAPVSQPPCVGDLHRVPDLLSLYGDVSGQVAPFAGADRPLCNRKEVTLKDQAQAVADFHLFTPAPIASKFTGMVLDDASSEFNAAAPDFGEKFAVPFVPVSIKDFNGMEISRTYTDQWGIMNGMVPSTWEANIANPSGFSPNMLTTCMNDPGPITDPVTGKLVTDPHYNPMYSNFCYTNPFMPGMTDYLDTPVLPVAAFASGYYPVDCAYPDTTPAVLRVDGDGAGPWVSATGHTLTITALGLVDVPNPQYAGPSALSPPGNQKTIKRLFNFAGGVGTVTLTSANGTVTTVAVPPGGWTDNTITFPVPVAAGSYQLGIINANGKKSVDTVTVTVGGTAPVRVPSQYATIQAAIDAAKPGDLVMVDAGTYNELVIMWKPVRLQGVGAASVIINAAKYPNPKLQGWRDSINSLFSIDTAGNVTGTPQVDPLPGQEITGGVILLEPSALSTEEGPGIAVVSKDPSLAPCSGPNNPLSSFTSADGATHHVRESNFNCAPSRIDGVSVTGGDTGGGVYVNGWAHNLEISNNRVYGNAGSLTGGVRIGQAYLTDQNAPPAEGYGYNRNIKVHNNAITTNGTVESNGVIGGAAGLGMFAGTDNYQVTSNFVCGNYSMGDGGGIGHVGYSVRGTIANNQIAFNQSFYQASTVNGGGLLISGESAGAGGSTYGAGRNITIDANLIQGNHAAGGSGGGVRLQNTTGTDPNFRNNHVEMTNNMIVDNVAGFAGGGISLANANHVRIVNNTIAHNDSTATVGPAFVTSPTTSVPQPAGISSELNSGGVPGQFANPQMLNNVIWQNRSFNFAPDTLSPTGYSLQPQRAAGDTTPCGANSNYWDLGVIGQSQTAPTLRMDPMNGILTSTTGGYLLYSASDTDGNLTTDPMLKAVYCNGPRFVSPAPPANPAPGPAPFGMIQVAGTADESGNWIDVRYGPISLTANPATMPTPGVALPLNGDAHLATGSPAIDAPNSTPDDTPDHDYDGDRRPQPYPQGRYDIGADEVVAPNTPMPVVSPAPLAFGNVAFNASRVLTIGVSNMLNATGPLTLQAPTLTATGPFAITGNDCPASLAAGQSCSISVTFNPTWTQATASPPAQGYSATLSLATNASTFNVAISGQAVTPSYVFNPVSHGFGNVSIRSATGSTFQFALVNRAASMADLTISGLPQLTGTYAGQFTAAFGTTNTTPACAAGASLAPGQSCAVLVTFKPTTTGAKGLPFLPGARLSVPVAAGNGSPAAVWGTGAP